MNIHELDSYDLGDAVKFNDKLNPRIWGADEKMRPEVREQLLKIADDFKEFLGIDVEVKDITVSGSNAAYTYTPHSDIDLHLVVDLPQADESDVYRELFDAKKYAYNDQHDIKIGGYDVELYVQDANKQHHSQGIYSLVNDDWVSVPKRRRPDVDDISVKAKFEDLGHRIEDAVDSGNYEQISALAQRIKDLRQAGLDEHGEFGPENLAFKMLRTQGLIKRLYDARNEAKDELLSLDERRKKKKKKKIRYGYGGYWYPGTAYAGQDHPAGSEGGDGGGDGGGESIREDAQQNTDEEILQNFIDFCVKELKIEHMPRVRLRRDPQWPKMHKTFGRYSDDTKTLEVAWGQRHIMDVLRTVAHELTHKHQHERDGERMGPDAGETGSEYENEANARAGILMRDWARLHPEHFDAGQVKDLEESASGYIPTKRQARDPRFSMALTVDIKPGQVGKEANKLKLRTDRQGHPQIAKANGLFENLYREYKNYKADEDYSPDKPPGPEFKPTMPAGTLRVDVSDVYDWYKLGQHIANMKGLGQHDFGQGPPSTIISFGDEDTEHKFIDDLKATGLDVTDIDPKDPKKRPGKKVKTDPTYNVDETIQAPVSKDRDAKQYYDFIVGKARLGRPLTRGEQDYIKMYQMYRQQKLAEFAPSPERDDNDDVPDQLLVLANRWWNATDKQPQIEHVLNSLGWSIHQVESEDDAVQLQHRDGTTYFISADEFDPDLYEDLNELALKSTLPVTQTMDHPAKQVYDMKTQSGEYRIVFGISNKDDEPDYDDPTGYLLDILLLGRAPDGSWTQWNTNVGEKEVAKIYSTIAQLAVKTIKAHPEINEIEIKGADPQRSRIYSRLMQQNIDSLLPGWKLGGEGLIRAKQAVAESSLYEYRDRMYQYIKSLVPTWPDYVVRDWLYANFARGHTTSSDADLEKRQDTARSKMFRYQYADQMNKLARSGKTGRQLPPGYQAPYQSNQDLKATLLAKRNSQDSKPEYSWTFATIKKDISGQLADIGLSANTKWQLVPNMKFTMDMWEPKTLKRLQARAGGSSTSASPDVHIPARDAERHATQAQLAQQQGGIRKEPVILVKTANGYELLEGWHRTIQHFARYPDGYVGPAYVAVAQGQQTVAENSSTSVSTEDMVAYIRKHHDVNLHADYLNHVMNTNSRFELKNIPLNSLKTELSGLDRAKVEQYKKKDFSKAPPIVVGSDGNILDGYHRAVAAKELNIPTIKAYVGVKNITEAREQQYLWHGSTNKIPVLTPRQAQDTGGAAGSNQNAIYATADKNTAIKMGMAERGSDTAILDQADQLVLFSGRLRRGKNVYLHQLPRYDANGQDMWLPGGNSNEFYTKPEVKEIKPLRVIPTPVDAHLDLVRKPTANDLKLRQKYLHQARLKQRGITEDEELDEVKMSPGALEKFATSKEAQGIRAGFEAELIFRDTQGESDEMDPEPDYDADERCYSIQQVIEFFDNDEYGYGMSDRERNRLEEALDESYMQWRDEQIISDFRNDAEDLIRDVLLAETPMSERIIMYLTDSMQKSDEEADRIVAVGEKAPRFTKSADQEAYAAENPDYELYLEAADAADAELDESVEDSVRQQDGYWDEALDAYRDNYSGDDDSFFSDVGLRWMSDVANEFGLDWPVWNMDARGNDGSRDWESIGDSLHEVVDMPVKVSSGYHSASRRPGMWVVEPDGSLDPDDKSEEMGLEIVSPPMPLLTAIEKLKQVVDWANDPNGGNAYTNSSTGLHMGVSLPTMKSEGQDNDPGIDYVKLILFMGDKYVQQQFGRSANTYCASALDKLRQNIKGQRSDPAGVVELLRHGLTELAHRELQKGVGTSKYTSAHIQPGYIEFRSPGGDWLAKGDEEIGILENTMLRFARAMAIAGDPSAERKEYAKKLYKLVTQDNEQYADQLRLFSEFSAGTISKEQLKKQWADTVLQKELPGTGKEEYEVYRRDRKDSPDGTVGTLFAKDYDSAYDLFLRQYGKDINDLDVRLKQPWFDVFDAEGKMLLTMRAADIDKATQRVEYEYGERSKAWRIYRRPDNTPEPKVSPRAQVAKRIATKPKTVDYNYEIIDRSDVNLRVVDRFYATGDQDASATFDRWLKSKNLPADTDRYGYRQGRQAADAKRDSVDIQRRLGVQDVNTDIAQNFEPRRQNYELVSDEDTDRVIHRMPNATADEVRAWIAQQEQGGMPPGFLRTRIVAEAIDPVSGAGAVPPRPTIKKKAERAVPPVEPVIKKQAYHSAIGQAISQQDLENMTSQIQIARKLGDDVNENFADGKKPGRKGLAKRMGVPTKASVSRLRQIAKSSTGEKARMAHWMANMKSGKKK